MKLIKLSLAICLSWCCLSSIAYAYAQPAKAQPSSQQAQAKSSKSASTAKSSASPMLLMQRSAKGMLRSLSRNQGSLKSNPNIVSSIVRRYVIPYVDIPRVSAMVVGQRYWRTATARQRQQFQRAFTNLVVQTYSVALSNYNKDKIRFYPIRGGVGGRKQVAIRTVIVRQSAPSIPVTYKLIKTASGWRVYDFSVENISMVSSYRSQFAPILSRSGFAGLLRRVQSSKVSNR